MKRFFIRLLPLLCIISLISGCMASGADEHSPVVMDQQSSVKMPVIADPVPDAAPHQPEGGVIRYDIITGDLYSLENVPGVEIAFSGYDGVCKLINIQSYELCIAAGLTDYDAEYFRTNSLLVIVACEEYEDFNLEAGELKPGENGKYYLDVQFYRPDTEPKYCESGELVPDEDGGYIFDVTQTPPAETTVCKRVIVAEIDRILEEDAVIELNASWIVLEQADFYERFPFRVINH